LCTTPACFSPYLSIYYCPYSSWKSLFKKYTSNTIAPWQPLTQSCHNFSLHHHTLVWCCLTCFAVGCSRISHWINFDVYLCLKLWGMIKKEVKCIEIYYLCKTVSVESKCVYFIGSSVSQDDIVTENMVVTF